MKSIVAVAMIASALGARVWEVNAKGDSSFPSSHASATGMPQHQDSPDPTKLESPCNATRTTSCQAKSSPSTDECPDFSTEAILSLDRSTWWHCEDAPTHCLRLLLTDVVDNLNQNECQSSRCLLHELPGQVVNLRLLEERLQSEQAKHAPMPSVRAKTDNASANVDKPRKFDEGMELLANVIVQKSRYCRFDIGAFSRLVQMITTMNTDEFNRTEQSRVKEAGTTSKRSAESQSNIKSDKATKGSSQTQSDSDTESATESEPEAETESESESETE